MDQLAADVIRCVGARKQGELGLAVGWDAAGLADVHGVLVLLPTGALSGAQDLVGHAGVGAAGIHAVDLDIVVAHLVGQSFDEPRQASLRRGIGRKIRPGAGGAAAAEGDNLAGALLDHPRQYRAAGMHHTDHVRFDGFGPCVDGSLRQGADRALHGGGADQHLNSAKLYAHAIDSGADLFEIPDVGSNAEGNAARVFNLQCGQVQFGFAAGEQSDTGSRGCKSDGQPFSDAAAGARYKNARVLQRVQGGSILRSRVVQKGESRSQGVGESGRWSFHRSIRDWAAAVGFMRESMTSRSSWGSKARTSGLRKKLSDMALWIDSCIAWRAWRRRFCSRWPVEVI